MSEDIQDPAAGRADSPGRRAAAYWFSDGLPEIVFGLVSLILGVLGMAWGFQTANVWAFAAAMAALCGFLALLWWDRKILDFLKARVTYPRTGYVRPPADPKPPFGGMVGIPNPRPYDRNEADFRGPAIVFFSAMVVAPMANGRWIVPVLMTIAAVLVYAFNRREALPYSWRSVLPIAVAGWASAWLDLPDASRHFLPILIGGGWLLSRGVWTLARYLRAHPRYTAIERP
jgi:hypothetical protein